MFQRPKKYFKAYCNIFTLYFRIAVQLPQFLLNQNYLEQWFLTFYFRRTSKIINGIHGPYRNHQIHPEKMQFMVHNFILMTSMDP